jgi:hypothetical protein
MTEKIRPGGDLSLPEPNNPDVTGMAEKFQGVPRSFR